MTEATLFDDGRVFTGLRYADSFVVEDGRVVAVGTAEEARRATPAGADRRPLHGRLVLPGLIDAHVHLPDLTEAREGLDLGRVASLPDLVDALRAWARDHPDGPLVGRGWDPERSSDRRWPSRHDLDGVVADRPLIVLQASGHAGIGNSAALDGAGVVRGTADPAGGRFGRESDGTPDGRAFERALATLVEPLDALTSVDPRALARTLRACAALGLTTLGAMCVRPDEAAAYREMDRGPALPVRVRAYLHYRFWREGYRPPADPTSGTGRFAIVGVKAFTDGALGPRTAWLSAPYSDDPGNSGMAVASAGELAEVAASVSADGLNPAFHAIGDRAVATALEALDRPRRELPTPPRIEHASLTPPEVWPALERVRPVLVVQPGFVWSDHWLASRLGADRARWAYAFRTLGGRGLVLAGSSDAPYDPVDPWRGIRAAVHRVDPARRSANPSPNEALSYERAVQLYTANGGVAVGVPGLGTLEVGAPGDVLVTAATSIEEAVESGAATVRETWVAGRPVASGADGQTV